MSGADIRETLLQELAELFVWELLRTHNRPLVPSVRAELIARTVGAMRQAIDQELQAITREFVDS